MAFKIFDRIKETTVSTGTGAPTLAGALTGFKTFASRYTNGDTLPYLYNGGAEWEVGLGTINLPGGTLTRSVVLASSNADALVNFSAGTKVISVSLPAAYAALTKLANAFDLLQTFTAGLTSNGPVTLNSTVEQILADNGAAGPIRQFYHNSATPAALDIIMGIAAAANDSAANKTVFADLYAYLVDPANNSEDAGWAFRTMVAGTLAERLYIAQGLYFPGITGGDPGAGKINFNDYQRAGKSISDFAILQRTATQSGAFVAGTGAGIPDDNTIPQITEGDEFLTHVFTPKSTTSKVVVTANFKGAMNTAGWWIVALFRDAVANALDVAEASDGGSSATPRSGVLLRCEFTPGALTPITFRIRAGKAAGGGTIYMNGDSNGSARFGGAMGSWIEAIEYVQ